MIQARFIAFFFGFIVISLLAIGLVNQEWNRKRFLSLLGCMLSLMIIVAFCFFPFPFQDELVEAMIVGEEGISNNYIPFRTIFLLFKEAFLYHSYSRLCYQVFGNILLFMPLGFSLFYYLKENKKFLKMLCCVLFVTILVEAEQALFNSMMQLNYRSIDFDDVMLNTLGGILGFSFAAFVIPYCKTLFKKKYRDKRG